MDDTHSGRHALIVAAYGRRFGIRLPDGSEVQGRPKGRVLRPVCGDRVAVEPLDNEPEWVIASILPRSSELARPDRNGRIEILAANIDLVTVIVAPVPLPDWFIVDRYLCAAALIGAEAIVLFNKIDLEALSPTAEAALDEYASIGYRTLQVSATERTELATLGDCLTGHVTVFVGQSGVGKSSLVNALFRDDALATAAISSKRREGRHTTVASRMRRLPDGGEVIDSPGVRDYAPAIDDPSAVARGFPEIYAAGARCRFADCAHLTEPACKVIEDVRNGAIGSRRYESYRRAYRAAQSLQRTIRRRPARRRGP